MNNNSSDEENNIDNTLDISEMIRQKHKMRKKTAKQQTHTRLNTTNDVKQVLITDPQITTENVESPKLITFRSPQNIELQAKKDPIFKKIQQTLKDIPTLKSFKSNGIYCRICFEIDEPLIKPCTCTKTRLYVHEECLKTQIIEDYKSRIRDATCTFCETKFNQNIKTEKIYMPDVGWEKSKDKLPLACMIVFMLVLLVIMTLLILQLLNIQDQSDTNQFLNNKPFIIIFIIFCIIIEAVLTWFIYMIVKGICYVERVYEWQILEQQIERLPSFLNKNIEIDDHGKILLKKQKSVELPQTNAFTKLQKFRQSVAF